MQMIDCRRLTGPNLLWDRPSVILDVSCTPEEGANLRPAWEAAVLRMYAHFGWKTPAFCARSFHGGISLAFDAPLDALYAGISLAEWAWEEVSGGTPDFNETASLIFVRAASDRNLRLRAMQAAAAKHGVPFLWDDDAVTVGHGARAMTRPPRGLVAARAVPWDTLGSVPVGLVTGTNGKTTSARIAAHILRAAGRRVGLSSTEGVRVDDEWLERGDYSGPGGARMVLRDARVQTAILETARGGLLRRGLGVDRADAALITNIAADHLGDFGSGTLQELRDIKWIVAEAARGQGTLVLNAEDPLLVERAAAHDGRIVWFSLAEGERTPAYHLRDDALVHPSGAVLCQATDIPLTLGGTARHNIANALGAAALCEALGATIEDMRTGLTSMLPEANPGRGNLFKVGGADVLVDFAHNPHAMAAIATMVRAWPAKRRLLAFAQAGDRTDALVRELTREAWAMQPDRVIFSELSEYARGRAPGELYGVVKDELHACGAPAKILQHVATEQQALEAALSWARRGDLLVLLILADGPAVQERLAALAN